jgi:histidine ammonia-lyase/tyrosine ammonia-lyase
MTGAACLALGRTATLLKLGVLASAYVVQCLRGSTRAFDHRGHALKNHPGQIAVAASLRDLLAGGSLTREHEEIMRAIAEKMSEDGVVDSGVYLQSAYSLRCIPQILGPVLETYTFCRRIVEEEVNACNDNPLIMETPEDTFHGGNFHGQYVAMACDYLAIGVVEIGALAERQLNRLVDPHLNGDLPGCLASGDPGLHCGYEGGQYLATSLASENIDLAAPSSVKSIPSNGSNQDIVSMGLTAARRALRVSDHVLTILATLVGACHQASWFLGAEKFSLSTQPLCDALGAKVPLYEDGFAIAEVLGQVRGFLASEQGAAYLNRVVDLGAGVEARTWDAGQTGAPGFATHTPLATAATH